MTALISQKIATDNSRFDIRSGFVLRKINILVSTPTAHIDTSWCIVSNQEGRKTNRV